MRGIFRSSFWDFGYFWDIFGIGGGFFKKTGKSADLEMAVGKNDENTLFYKNVYILYIQDYCNIA